MVHSALHFFLLASALLLLLVHAHGKSEKEIQMNPEFSYFGDNGPDKWGSLSPSYATCQSGKLQSPIDIAKNKIKPKKDLKALDMHYKVCNATFINRGCLVELILGDAGEFKFGGKEYAFKKITFHNPSEHFIYGQQYDAEAQLVHEASDGSMAIIGILYQIGNADDPVIAKVQNQLTELGKGPRGANPISKIEVDQFNAPKMVGPTRKYYHYVGSLTIPPCTENVDYFILGEMSPISNDQVNLLNAPLDTDSSNGNDRPLQPINHRRVGLYSEL